VAAIPHSELVVLDACGHVPQEEKPALVTDLILGTLADVE
jgi:pimeloyl-ACP methyl ester carboxylesterase